MATNSVKLTHKEEMIFEFLLKVIDENNLKTTVRVAGGWVRDKLYGIANNDIDIALDDLYGKQFASYINRQI